MAFDDIITRDAGTDPLVPEPVTAQIIQEMPAASAVLGNARRVTMSALTQRQPVLSALPSAFFLSAEAGSEGTGALKQTTSQDWKNLTLVAEELATIVPIPEAYFDDSMVPVWDEVRPRLVEAAANLIDGACLFGVSKPSTWGPAVYQAAVGAGNVVVNGSGDDIAQEVALLGQQLAEDGFSVNGFASKPGFGWQLVGIRTDDGQPIYQPNLQGGGPGNLYGFPLREVRTGAWDAAEALLIAGDWSKAIVGVRQDISFRVFSEGVIQDCDGNIVVNLMQEDALALRMTMRLAWQVANPVTRVNTTDATRFPFAVLQAAGYTYS